MTIRHLLAAALLATAVAAPPTAAQDIETVRVQFEPGTTSAIVEGAITGDQIVDYVLGAAEGQAANISMATQHPAAYFNILPPGSDNKAIHIGNIAGNQFEGALPASGDYKIRLYLMRSAARRGETADYRLEMIVAAATAPAPAPTTGDESTAARAGQGDFDATGQVPCKRHEGQPTGQCEMGVARGSNGEASVAVTHPDGFQRILFFEGGAFLSADLAGASAGWEISTRRDSDLTVIRLGPERYEIPDAVVFGG